MTTVARRLEPVFGLDLAHSVCQEAMSQGFISFTGWHGMLVLRILGGGGGGGYIFSEMRSSLKGEA